MVIAEMVSVGVSVRHFLHPARGLVFQTGGDPPFGFLEAQHGSEYAP
jgi:heat shock protein HspQ